MLKNIQIQNKSRSARYVGFILGFMDHLRKKPIFILIKLVFAAGVTLCSAFKNFPANLFQCKTLRKNFMLASQKLFPQNLHLLHLIKLGKPARTMFHTFITIYIFTLNFEMRQPNLFRWKQSFACERPSNWSKSTESDCYRYSTLFANPRDRWPLKLANLIIEGFLLLVWKSFGRSRWCFCGICCNVCSLNQNSHHNHHQSSPAF